MIQARTFRIGTRGSKLARWQSDWVAAQLTGAGVSVQIVEIATQGDLQQHGPVSAVGGLGVFTKEIQSALLAGEVDLAVHSLKDLPTQDVEGLTLAATPPREDLADVLISRSGQLLMDLPAGARIGTGSLRRRAQLLHLRPDLVMADIRGNVDTRLRKLDEGQFDAIVLAAAGLRRLGFAERITETLGPPRMLPAPGQGALGIECRVDDAGAIHAVGPLDDPATRRAVEAERAALAALHGGCSAPIAAWGRVQGERLQLDVLVASADGRIVLRQKSECGHEHTPADLGGSVAEMLKLEGAEAIIAASRGV
jgi:hydroxymethylbilane synthase